MSPYRVNAPTRTVRRKRALRALVRRAWLVAALGALASPIAGCAAVSSWWQAFEQDPAGTISQLVSYVEGLVSTARALWAILAPLLGINTPAATADFEAAIVSVEDASSALQDAVSAAVLAHQDHPDFSALVGKLQDAVAKLVAIVAQWEGVASQGGAQASAKRLEAHAVLARQAQAVAHWRH